jgi:DNA-binding YbaB/EbfC family protein
MNQMQQMLANAQRMQKALTKAHAELDAKEFAVSKNGMVEMVVLGNRTIKSINIDEEALSADNKEMLEETIVLALNEALEQINKANEEIEQKITGQAGMLF